MAFFCDLHYLKPLAYKEESITDLQDVTSVSKITVQHAGKN